MTLSEVFSSMVGDNAEAVAEIRQQIGSMFPTLSEVQVDLLVFWSVARAAVVSSGVDRRILEAIASGQDFYLDASGGAQ